MSSGWKSPQGPASIQRMAEAVFESRGKALEWLESPINALRGEVPKQLLDTSEGRERVLQVLKTGNGRLQLKCS